VVLPSYPFTSLKGTATFIHRPSSPPFPLTLANEGEYATIMHNNFQTIKDTVSYLLIYPVLTRHIRNVYLLIYRFNLLYIVQAGLEQNLRKLECQSLGNASTLYMRYIVINFYFSMDKSIAVAWHQSFQCSGIKTCGYPEPEIIRPCDAYDRVNMQIFTQTAQRLGRRSVGEGVDGKLKRQTEE
jgi:hypothetical protein